MFEYKQKLRSKFFFTCLLLFWPVSGSLFANGIYIPAPAYEKLPEIPTQTAAIFYEDGTETLIVESAMMAAAGDEFAWIVPVPANPARIGTASPGLMETLRLCVRRPIHNPDFGTIVLPLLLISFSSCAIIFFARKHPRAGNYFVVFFIIAGMSLISVSSGPGETLALSTDEAATLQHARIGNYEVNVVRAHNAMALNEWLNNRNFAPMPPAAESIVQSYIDDGWFFLASRLIRESGSLLTPHPLQITFPSAAPVYPMRLTALAQSETRVTVFLFGPTTYSNPQLPGQLCGEVNRDDSYLSVRNVAIESFNHPELAVMVSDRDWVTRLEGKLSPDQMATDFYFDATAEPAPFIQELWTPSGALYAALKPTLWFFMIASILIASLLSIKSAADFPLRTRLAWSFILPAVVCLIWTTVRFIPIPKTDFPLVFGKPGDRFTYVRRISQELAAHPVLHTAADSPQDRRNAVAAHMRENFTNPYTGRPMEEMLAPGNFGFEDSQGKPHLVFYDMSLSAIRLLPVD